VHHQAWPQGPGGADSQAETPSQPGTAAVAAAETVAEVGACGVLVVLEAPAAAAAAAVLLLAHGVPQSLLQAALFAQSQPGAAEASPHCCCQPVAAWHQCHLLLLLQLLPDALPQAVLLLLLRHQPVARAVGVVWTHRALRMHDNQGK
jgi:hypothetical protein